MDTKALRQKILDLAIRGKLVPQDPNDEPASALLERIRAEKERLIAEGKIKRPKRSKSTSSESHYQNFIPPFPIPDSWEWVKLGDVCDVARGGSPRPIKSFLTQDENGVNWIKIGDTDKDGKYINSTKEKIIPEGVSKSRLVHKGDFLLTNSMSFGRPYILNVDGCIHDGWLVISPIGNVFDKDFLYILLSSDYAFYQFSDKASGSAVSNLNSDKVAASYFPLPPLPVQRKIVQAVDCFLSILINIEDEQSIFLQGVKTLKSKILELAMQGKLVPQDPADEPAADMLRRINPKARIITDNPHYPQLPANWVLVALEDIVDYEQPQPFIVSNTNYSDKFETPVLTAGKSFILGYTDEDFGIYKNCPVIIFDDFTTDSRLVGFPFKVKSSAMKILSVRKGINIEFVAAFMSITRLVGETHKRYWISEYSKILIPIPPKEEQERIISAISKINEMLDSIESHLN